MRNERGYSLIELLVVLALLGLIAIAMSGGIRFGARVWESAGARVEALEQTQGAQALLRQVLSAAMPRVFDSLAPTEGTFIGSADRMTFTAAAPPAFRAGATARFALSALRTGHTVPLKIAWIGEGGAAARHEWVLLKGARNVAFSYGAVGADGRVVWASSWAPEAGVPRLVRIRADFEQARATRWPELIVRTRIDRDPSCIFDAVSFECRRA